MKPFIAIIGDRNSGKTTIIRSLTGCRTGSFIGEIEEHIHHTKIYVIAPSPQEMGISRQELRTHFQTVAHEQAIRGIAIALQPGNTRTRLSMEDTIRLAQQTGGFNFHAFIIDPPYPQNGQNNVFNVDDVRNRLQAFGIESISIVDGRRFSHIAARDIQQITGLL